MQSVQSNRDEKLKEDVQKQNLSNGNDAILAAKHIKHHHSKLKTEKSQLFSQITIEVPVHLTKQKQLHEIAKRPSMVAEIRIDTVEAPRRQSEPGVLGHHRLHPKQHLRLSPMNSRRSSSSTTNCNDPRRTWRRSPSPSLATLNPGYDQYQKSLLEVPWCADYGDASSDDLSSEWDSDVPEQPVPSLPKVYCYSMITQWTVSCSIRGIIFIIWYSCENLMIFT